MFWLLFDGRVGLLHPASPGTHEPYSGRTIRNDCDASARGSARDLDSKIATLPLCGNLRIKTWGDTPSPDGSPIPPPQKTNVEEDESSKPLDGLLIEALVA
jgi:hypothetical protein